MAVDLAIIGMSGRFPGAKDYEQYWSNLKAGVNSIREITPDRWDIGKYYSPNIEEPNKSVSKWCGLLDDVDQFDTQFFQISPREANNMDPQQRLLLEETWRCIEDSGVRLAELQKHRTAVYVGVMAADYRQEAVATDVETDSYACLGSYECILANRISYTFNLQGPSVSINAACASSLVAIHESKRSLLSGESDYALASGVSLNIHPWKYISFSKSRMLSPDGQCKTFDKDANGYVPGEGIGVVLLQRLEDAIKAGNRIYGIIKGTAVNHGGKAVSITAPRVESQQDVILSAYRDAGLSPETVTYVEAHGTGTSLGDPIEIESLTKAFRTYTNRTQFCKIGSVKTNIGHLEAAAGVAGVIKVVQMMKNRQIPPSLHIKTVNPIIQFERSPFQVATELSEWQPAKAGEPLRAGISSFGFGGVNSHIILEEYMEPAPAEAAESDSPQRGLFVLSAKTEASLQRMLSQWQGFVKSDAFAALEANDLTGTLLTGRESFAYRVGFPFVDKDHLASELHAAPRVFQIKKAPQGGLHIGEAQVKGFREIEEILSQNRLLEEQVNRLLNQLQEVTGEEKLVKGFKRKTWYDSKKPLNNFIIGLAYLETLVQMGLPFEKISVEGAGVWIGLALSQMVSVQEILAVLCGVKPLGELVAKRPSLPFLDPVSGSPLYPYRFTAGYLGQLLNRLPEAVSEESFADKFRKAQLLFHSQFTFKRHLEEWSLPLRQYGLNLQELLAGAGVSDRRVRLLLTTAIVSSLRKLNQKWNLTEVQEFEDSRFYEVIDLLVDDRLPKGLFVSCVLDMGTNLEDAAEELNQRAQTKAFNNCYPLLMEHESVLTEVGAFDAWLRKAMESSGTGTKEGTLLQFGQVADPVADAVTCRVGDLQRVLLDLWLRGVSIHWSKLYPESSFRKAALPLYEFDRESFWLPHQQTAAAKVEAQAAVPWSKPEPLLNVTQSNEDSTARVKHIVLHMAANVLGVSPKEMDADEPLVDYGWEPVHLTELLRLLRNGFRIDLQMELFLGADSVSAVVDTLIHAYPEVQREEGQDGNLFSDGIVIKELGQTSETRRVLLEKTWQEQDTLALRGDVTGTILLLTNRESRQTAERLAQQLTNARAVLVEVSSEAAKENDVQTFNPAQAESGQLAARNLLRQFDKFTGVLDMSDLYADRVSFCKPSVGKMMFLQELVKAKRQEGFRLLHLSRGLQEFQSSDATLAGADTAGLVKMLGAEYRKIKSRTVDVDVSVQDDIALLEIVKREWSKDELFGEVCIRNGRRFVPVYREASVQASAAPSRTISSDAVYVITGGTRGIGAEIARHLVQKGARKLALLGVQPYPPRESWQRLLADACTDQKLADRIRNIVRLEAEGVQVELFTGSLLDRAALNEFFGQVRKRLGRIGGVVHGGGVISHENPAFIAKTVEEFTRVFEPKIGGVQVLHDLLAEDRPDFFVLFSSVSGAIPMLATGLSDYAVANAFLDAFVAFQRRQGYSFYHSIQWPNWKEVGMGDVTGRMYLHLGFTAHLTVDGLALFDEAISQKHMGTVMPAVVDRFVFVAENLLQIPVEEPRSVNQADAKPAKKANSTRSLDDTVSKLKELFAAELNMAPNKMDEDLTFGEFGVDSILLTLLVKRVEAWIGIRMDPSLFLEYPTLNRLGEYLHPFTQGADEVEESGEDFAESVAAGDVTMSVLDLTAERLGKSNVELVLPPASGNGSAVQKIAVIGMACHFPGAPDKETFWRNLTAGISSIREVPGSRWNAEELYAPEFAKGKTISKWGGFLDNIEWFDPNYFGLSEEDAAQIDPLVRQFLEVSVQTLCDAGYRKEELSGRNVGVFVGSRVSNYATRINKVRKNTITGIGQNFIGAHVSHFFNFKGPNLVVDTACSSSLVSLHLACQSLRNNESEMALAGGVDILLDEQLYLILSEGKALSPDGKCHTFDEKANGFVPGEGCGAVLLKPLEKAIADGDRIYAVIETTEVNNDGHTMGITTPNPDAQAEMIRKALSKSGLSPETISYVETHGTGTMIGDPIELKALTRIFREYTQEKQFCAVGSVKTNIGHLLSAAGMASLIKVALSIWHKQLPPTLNCETPNPRFEFEQSPFYPNTSLQEWKVEQGVRRSSISSFGFGGTNAYTLVSECDPAALRHYQPKRSPLPPVIFNRRRFWLEASEQKIQKRVEREIASVFQEAAATRENRSTPDLKRDRLPMMLQFVEEKEL